jgi:hypothetical protein
MRPNRRKRREIGSIKRIYASQKEVKKKTGRIQSFFLLQEIHQVLSKRQGEPLFK